MTSDYINACSGRKPMLNTVDVMSWYVRSHAEGSQKLPGLTVA